MKVPPPLSPEAVQRQIRAARLHGLVAAIDRDGSEGPATAALRSVIYRHYVHDPLFREDGTDVEMDPALLRGNQWMRRYMRRALRYLSYHEEGLLRCTSQNGSPTSY